MEDEETIATEEDAASEYDAGFGAAIGDDEQSGADSAKDVKEAPDAENASTPENEPQESDDDALNSEAEQQSIERLNKRLADTQRAFTRASTENAELKRLLKEQEAGRATQLQVDQARDAAQQASDAAQQRKGELDSVLEQALSDYPELKPALDAIVGITKTLQKEVATLRTSKEQDDAEKARDASREVFEAVIKPKILAAHPDYDAVMLVANDKGKMVLSDEYYDWAEKQSPALKFAALESGHPDDMIHAISEYKKHKGIANAPEQAKTNEKLINAQTLRGGSSPFPVKVVDQSGDYDSGFTLATKGSKSS